MPAQTLFPRWHELSQLEEARWAADADTIDDDEFSEILNSALEDQSRTSLTGGGRIYALSEAIERDIIDLQACDLQICDLINLHYLQFEVSIAPIKLAINAGAMHLAYDWILNGFSDEVSVAIAREFFGNRIYDFLETPIDWIVLSRTESLSEWFGSFYYYCWKRAALYEVAEGLVYPFIQVAGSASETVGPKLVTFLYFLNWASTYDHPIMPHASGWTEQIFNNPATSPSDRARIAVSFSTNVGRLTDRSNKEWAEWALRNARAHLHQHEPFQLLITTVETETDWQRARDEVLQALHEFITSLRIYMGSPTKGALVIDQRAQILNSTVFLLHRLNLRDDLLRIFCIWYDVAPDRRLDSSVLFVLPNHGFGMAYLGDGAQLLEDPNWFDVSCEVNDQTNRALNIFITVQGEVAEEPIPERPGVPNYEMGHEFEQAVSRLYQFDRLNAELFDGAQALVSFPSYPRPLQPLMRSITGATLPIAASLEVPEPDRAITQAGIWCAGNEIFSRMETEAIERVLEEAGISVQTLHGEENTKEDFLRFYGDPRHDLVWVIGHGIYDHWNPSSPAVVASDGANVTIDEFLENDLSGPNRRLLVLNICDGGVAAVLGGIHRLGLAPMLASHKQATLAHLWPVSSRVVAAYGVMLAQELSTGQPSFFHSFEVSLDRLKRPWREISDDVSEIAPGDLADRLQNFDPDMSNIFQWGSPCFFQ